MDAVILALLKSMAGKGGGGLPPVTPSDNGKVLGVVDGAWAAENNVFVVTVTGTTPDKTFTEVVAAYNAGKIVIANFNGTPCPLSYVNNNDVSFISARYSDNKIDIFYLNKSNTWGVQSKKFLPSSSASDNGSELIVKNGSWAKQQKKFVVTLTPTSPDYSGTMDKTVAEINAAYEAGQEIVFRVIMSETQFVDVNVTAVLHDSLTYPSFNAFVIEINSSTLVYAHIPTTDDGTTQTYSTTVYSLTPAS